MKVAVMGAGAGGQAIAAALSMRGHEVTLYNRKHPVEDLEILAPLQRAMKVKLEGALSGEGHLASVTNDLRKAVTGQDVIMLTVPAVAHEPFAAAMAPILEAGQTLIIHPAQIGSAWGIKRALGDVFSRINLVVTHTLLYACRTIQVGQVMIHGVKKTMRCAALPASRTSELIPLIQALIPQAIPVQSALEAELSNINTIVHPGVVLGNLTRMEKGEAFEFYKDGATDATTRLIAEMDQERMQVAAALGLRPVDVREFLIEGYGVPAGPLGEMARNNPGYAGILAPTTLKHRYVWEDVTCGLTPLAALGSTVGVPTPMIEAAIKVLTVAVGAEMASYRTGEWLGIHDLKAAEVIRLAKE